MGAEMTKSPISLIRHGVMLCASLVLWLKPASATDFPIHLPGSTPVSRETVSYTCDSEGSKIGLPPAGKLDVEYINAGGNALVVVPISGNHLIFANVSSASGARYRAQQYTWWEAKGAVTFYSDSLNGKLSSACSRAKH
jgi:membrane-bound inhibitor of C-type lysozyme